MKKLQRRRPRDPEDGALRKDLEGGPLSRELLTIQLIRLGEFMVRYCHSSLMRHASLTELELRVLIFSCEVPPVSVNELSKLVHRGAGQVSRVVQKMVDAGLLHRANRGGGPTVSITPTALGREVYGPLVEMTRAMDGQLMQGIAASDRPTLERWVARLTHNAVTLLQAEPAPDGPARPTADRRP